MAGVSEGLVCVLSAGEFVEAVGAPERGTGVGVASEGVRVAVEGDEELSAGLECERVLRVVCED